MDMVQSMDADAKTVLVESEEYSLVQVHLTAMDVILHEGDYVVVYLGGAIALSYPAQAGRLVVDVYAKAKGMVTKSGAGHFTLDTETGSILVNTGDKTVLSDALEEGDEVTVLYNGQIAFSMPPQIFR